MSIVIEDGSIVSGANSYNTTVELDTYLSDRGYDVPSNLEPPLIISYDYMLLLPWIEDQSEAYTVTYNHKKAQLVIAKSIIDGLSPSSKPSNKIKSEKVGPIETEYFSSIDGASGVDFLNYTPDAKALLSSLIVFPSNRLEKA